MFRWHLCVIVQPISLSDPNLKVQKNGQKIANKHCINTDLSSHAYGAGVEMALAHHGAAHNDERGRGETELVRAQQRRYQHIVTSAHLSVSLHTKHNRQLCCLSRVLN